MPFLSRSPHQPGGAPLVPAVAIVDGDTRRGSDLARHLDQAHYQVHVTRPELAQLPDSDIDVAVITIDDAEDGPSLLSTLRNRRHLASATVIAHDRTGRLASYDALAAGADDYVPTHAPVTELLARVSAHARLRQLLSHSARERADRHARLARGLAAVDQDGPLAAVADQIGDTVGDVTGIDLSEVTVEASTPATQSAHQPPGVEQITDRHVTLTLRGAGSPVGTLTALLARPDADAAHQLHEALTSAEPQLTVLLRTHLLHDARRTAARTRILQLLDPGGGLTAAFQPIVTLPHAEVVGYEGLTRLPDARPPMATFLAATDVGLGQELELRAIETILHEAQHLPDGTWVSVNLSADTYLTAELEPLLNAADRIIVLELTEHDQVHDYEQMNGRYAHLDHVKLAVDDTGAGYSSLRHVVELQPDVVKLDRSWVAQLDTDPARRALVTGIAGVAGAIGADVVGEGVERAGEADTLHELGVAYAQGFLFGRPQPIRKN